MSYRLIKGFVFISLLHLMFGMLVRAWFKAGFPFKMDFLTLFMLTPPLLLFDGITIYNGIKSSNKIALVSLSLSMASFIVGVALGWPKT